MRCKGITIGVRAWERRLGITSGEGRRACNLCEMGYNKLGSLRGEVEELGILEI